MKICNSIREFRKLLTDVGNSFGSRFLPTISVFENAPPNTQLPLATFTTLQFGTLAIVPLGTLASFFCVPGDGAGAGAGVGGGTANVSPGGIVTALRLVKAAQLRLA